MSQQLGLEWYSVHKLNPDKLDLKAFSEIVGRCQIDYGVDNVSLQYRKKILLLFQVASREIKNQIP